MDQARGLSVPTRGKVAFALAVVSAEGLRDDGVYLWLRDVFRGGASGKMSYGKAWIHCRSVDFMLYENSAFSAETLQNPEKGGRL